MSSGRARARRRSAAFALATVLAAGLGPVWGCARVPLPDDPIDDSILAGYKAGTTCSAVFVAGRALDDILVDELAAMPPAARLPAPEVDVATRTVRAAYAPGRAPRLAAYRDGVGCTTLPPGADLDDVRALPRVERPRSSRDASRIPWPDGDLVPAGLLPEGVDRERLERAVEAAFDGDTYGEGTRTVGVLVVYGGRPIAERYREGFGPDTPTRTWSVAKSLTSALVGILVGQGRLALGEPAPIPEFRGPGDPRGAIELEHLLHMESGLERAGAVGYPIYFGGADALTELPRARLEAAPGTRWHYANRDTLLLVRAIRATLADDAAYHAFPYGALFQRIGMRHTVAELDAGGNFVLSSQVWSTPRDLARFGLLYLRDGVWNGERVLPEGWVDYTRQPAPARRTGLRALWSYGLPGLLGYGAQFWLTGGLPWTPDDAYGAFGSRGQCISIVPSEDLVVVRTGLDPEPSEVLWRQDRFLADLVAALRP
jgi:CubicO group peptidase (beta-lactamase class C family)